MVELHRLDAPATARERLGLEESLEELLCRLRVAVAAGVEGAAPRRGPVNDGQDRLLVRVGVVSGGQDRVLVRASVVSGG